MKDKKKEKSGIYQFIAFVLFIIVMIFISYGAQEIAKTISYSWWYEDMVKETVREMVKPEYLKDIK